MKKYKVKKAIILAGGTGSRLLPLTKVTNKHLLPIGKDPMIIHPIKKVVSAGIQDVMIVTGTEHMGDMVSLLGSGKDYSCRFTYKVQDTPDGIAGALNLCKDFALSTGRKFDWNINRFVDCDAVPMTHSEIVNRLRDNKEALGALTVREMLK